MRVTYHVEGGLAYFPGLARATTVDSGALPSPQPERLASLVNIVAAEASMRASAPPSVADAQVWEITVEEEQRAPRRISINEAVATPPERELMDLLRSTGGRTDGPPG